MTQINSQSLFPPQPRIIQGGMGAAVSGWQLARAVSKAGQLGVVSGTALGAIVARRLQVGDAGGDVRRALKHFPIAGVAERIVEKYFIPGGKPADQPFRLLPFPTVQFNRELMDLTVAANFCEVFLAKEGHAGLVGINYLEKIQTPTLPSLFGAMLAGVDYVLMGAGVPRAIPGVLDALAKGEAVRLKIDVSDLPPGEEIFSTFDPKDYGACEPLKRPLFLAIIASATLAMALARKSTGKVDGFVVEGSSAGGHNAPPRGPLQLNDRGEPLYGPADVPDLDRIAALGLPFWLAGSYGNPEMLGKAIELGAAGIQVGTLFAFCDESGITPELKREVLGKASGGALQVFTSPIASPTGFPFKVVNLPQTLSNPAVYESRTRKCDLGYLRSIYHKADGTIGYRCPAEPEETYVQKGGKLEQTTGRACLCNGLVATVGLGDQEPAIVTSGDDIARLAQLVKPGHPSYSAADVIAYLLSQTPASRSETANAATAVALSRV